MNYGIKASYRKWASMLRRCFDPQHPSYGVYGGKGITVCEQWRGEGGYEHFLADMGEPRSDQTLGRVKSSGNYEPGNCMWATWKEQAANRRKGGPAIRPESLRQLAKKAGLPYAVVYYRHKRAMWTLERALSTPMQPKGSNQEANAWRKEQDRVDDAGIGFTKGSPVKPQAVA